MQQTNTLARERRAATLAILPPLAFATIEGQVVIVKRGERGVFRPNRDADSIPVTADALNASFGVTPEQAAAMMIGANFGWDAPGADPEWWGA